MLLASGLSCAEAAALAMKSAMAPNDTKLRVTGAPLYDPPIIGDSGGGRKTACAARRAVSGTQDSEAIANSGLTAIGSMPATESARRTAAATATRTRTGRRNRVEAISRAAPLIRSRHAVSFIASSGCGLADI